MFNAFKPSINLHYSRLFRSLLYNNGTTMGWMVNLHYSRLFRSLLYNNGTTRGWMVNLHYSRLFRSLLYNNGTTMGWMVNLHYSRLFRSSLLITPLSLKPEPTCRLYIYYCLDWAYAEKITSQSCRCQADGKD